MKKSLRYLYCLLSFSLGLISCSGGYDNYDAPEETLRGTIIDTHTKKGIETQVGGVRLRLLELSWSDSPTPYYFNTKQDGTFNNTKIFKGNYNVLVEGAFVPLLQYTNGAVTVDNSKTLDISGVTELNFEVEPFLNIEWVGKPVLESDGKVSVEVKLSRGTANPDFQQNITDIYFFLNLYPYIGDNEKDDRLSNRIDFASDAQPIMDGRTIKLTSKEVVGKTRTYYLRVGARIDKESFGGRRYNYTAVQSIVIP